MVRAVLVALILAAPAIAAAQLYKYTDKNGKTVYSDVPPPDAVSKTMNVPSSGGPSNAPKTAVQRDKELDTARKDSREKATKGEQKAQAARDNEERCAAARSNYRLYQEGGRIVKLDEKGERVYLEDSEIAEKLEKARAIMDEACKG
jgi:hypothetical protein